MIILIPGSLIDLYLHWQKASTSVTLHKKTQARYSCMYFCQCVDEKYVPCTFSIRSALSQAMCAQALSHRNTIVAYWFFSLQASTFEAWLKCRPVLVCFVQQWSCGFTISKPEQISHLWSFKMREESAIFCIFHNKLFFFIFHFVTIIINLELEVELMFKSDIHHGFRHPKRGVTGPLRILTPW